MKIDDRFNTLRQFNLPEGGVGYFHSLQALEDSTGWKVSRLPVSLRVLLESVVRNFDGLKVTQDHVQRIATWEPNGSRDGEVPLVVSRILLQDLNGVPLIADLSAMRDAALALDKDPALIEPSVHVDMVIDHSIQVDISRTSDSLVSNMKLEFERNEERYQFMKWGAQAFQGLNVIPPGMGICHQVNLERLATGVSNKGDLYFPDTVVCPDSHTTMINGIGVLGWGVGGIEAEAGMLGQPVHFLIPNVTGVELVGKISSGVTATDLVLGITERLRKEKVVGDFVEFFGEGAAGLPVPTRATIANMAPEYGAFIGFFPMDELTVQYFRDTNRPAEVLQAYMQAQGMLGMPKAGDLDYTRIISIDLGDIVPSIAGPRRPQDRISIENSRQRFDELFERSIEQGGFGASVADRQRRVPVEMGGKTPSNGIGHGDVLIAAITSCTNTSNPAVMLGAGLLAQKALAKGLSVAPHIKTSMAPGSRAVTHYLEKSGLLDPLAKLGFDVVAYGCTTCIGNSGPLHPSLERVLESENLVACAVLSGNRNFEARIHGGIKANYLASPPLVVAYAIAGRMDIDLTTDPLGVSSEGKPVFLRDIWPSDDEVDATIHEVVDGEAFTIAYETDPIQSGWMQVDAGQGGLYKWPDSTYLARPPFFDDFSLEVDQLPAVKGARALAIFGDSLTTDHISPAGEIRADSPAGKYLLANGVQPVDFNTYGARRGNHEVMMRGTFANRRIKNLINPRNADGTQVEGGVTIFRTPDGQPSTTSIYDAAMEYKLLKTPVVVFGGEEYGTGSARDWAAKGTFLLGVNAVIVSSFERIHRSNLVLMGVLPLEFEPGNSAKSLGLDGSETYEIVGIDSELSPRKAASLVVTRQDGSVVTAALRVRLDTAIEIDYYRHGGIVPYVLRQMFTPVN